MAVDKEHFEGGQIRPVRPPVLTPRGVYRQACGDYSVDIDVDLEVAIPGGRTVIVQKSKTFRATDTTGRKAS